MRSALRRRATYYSGVEGPVAPGLASLAGMLIGPFVRDLFSGVTAGVVRNQPCCGAGSHDARVQVTEWPPSG